MCSVVSDSLRPHGLYPARSLSPWDSPGKHTGVGCHVPSPGDLPDPGIVPASAGGVWNSQGGGKDKLLFFSLRSLVTVTNFFFKPRTDDYTTNSSA